MSMPSATSKLLSGECRPSLGLSFGRPWAWLLCGLKTWDFRPAPRTPIFWRKCQAEELVLVTDNRTRDSSDSLEATLRQYNRPDCLPVFTIGNLDKFRTSARYVEKVVESLYEYLFRIDEVRGTGRLYLP